MRRSYLVAALCLLAFALSYAYVAYYLRGSPRVIDATSYFLEARSLSGGSFGFDVPDPTAAFRGRFLLQSSDPHRLGVIFPPGYPLVLSLGVRLGAPLIVGPLLGALLVAATYRLARALGQDTGTALLAATLSALCAALRYHTADTMSHGLATLLGVSALGFALQSQPCWGSLVAGACLGLLVATRPVSAAVAIALVGWCLRQRPKTWLVVALGMLPGVLLLLLQQRALTGSFFSSVQMTYYDASDAPRGCFRYGFGSGIGCRFEHGDYVTRFLPNGYGAYAALRKLGVHLRNFASDATNFAPLTLAAAYALFKRAHSPLALLGVGILLQALAYVPFYFDGDYPGGGARFLCEAIPFCQILVARAASDLRVPWLLAPAAIVGFVFFARPDHEALRDRQGGRPMFEPAIVAQAGVTHGLVLVDTDHGFNLGFDPQITDPRAGVVVARARGDAHDRELYARLGAPPTYRYEFDLKAHTAPRLVAFVPRQLARYEAEAEWPAQLEPGSTGSAYPTHYPCASKGRALRLLPGTTVALPFPQPGPSEGVYVGWMAKTAQGAVVRVRWSGHPATLMLDPSGPGCSMFEILGPPPGGAPPLFIELVSGEGAVDFVQVGGESGDETVQSRPPSTP